MNRTPTAARRPIPITARRSCSRRRRTRPGGRRPMNTTSAAAAPRAPTSRAWRRSATPIPAGVCRSSTARPTAAARRSTSIITSRIMSGVRPPRPRSAAACSRPIPINYVNDDTARGGNLKSTTYANGAIPSATPMTGLTDWSGSRIIAAAMLPMSTTPRVRLRA